MSSDDSQSLEATNPVLGSLKISSANLNTLFTVLGFIVTVLVAWTLFNHGNETKEASRDLVMALKDMTQAAREQNCLMAFPVDRREANADLCKRLSR